MEFTVEFKFPNIWLHVKNPGAKEALEALEQGLDIETLANYGTYRSVERKVIPLKDLFKKEIREVFTERTWVTVFVAENVFVTYLKRMWVDGCYTTFVDTERLYVEWIRAGCPIQWDKPEQPKTESED